MDDCFLDKDGDVEISAGGNLPHWHQEGKVQFVTFRLADSLPQSVVDETKKVIATFRELNPEPWSAETMQRYRNLVRKGTEKFLDRGYGSCILARKEIRDIVSSALHYYDGTRYDLIAYVVMPNHVHVIICPYEGQKASEIFHDIKGFSAREINRKLNRKGQLWFRESFDRLIRSEEDLKYKIAYIKNNPKHLTSDQFDLYIG